MRIANYDNRAFLVTHTALDGTPIRGIDIETASNRAFDSDPQLVFDRWADFALWAKTDGSSASTAEVEFDRTLLGAPAPRPRQVFAIALNYVAHAEESNLAPPTAPPTFTKFPTCLTGPYSTVDLPSRTVDWEVELVVVISKRAERVREVDAWSYVAGLTVGQDLSERTVQLAGPAPQFSLGKSFPGFGPMGPALVSPDELATCDDLKLSTHLDGEEMQAGRTCQMIFGVSTLVQRLSDILPLLPGDVIFTGTPSGIGAARTPPRFLAPGQELVSTIQGVGQLRNLLRAGTTYPH